MMDRRSGRIPRSLLGGFAIAFLFVGLIVIMSPRIVQATPLPGSSNVPSTTDVRIEFSRAMDPASVESGLIIEPAVPGSFLMEERTMIFKPAQPWTQGIEVKLRLVAGTRSTGLIPMLRTRSWSFRVSRPRVLYLWPEGAPADLYARSLDDDAPTRLTETAHGILDFCIGQDGRRIIYAAARQDGGSDLRELDLTTGEDRLEYACPEHVRCQALALDPGGWNLAFERIGFLRSMDGSLLPGPSRVWVLDRLIDEAFPIGSAEHETMSPQWSTAGWLAFYDATLKAIALVDVQLGPEPEPYNYIPNDLGLMGSWSPQGQVFVYSAIVLLDQESNSVQGADFFSHLYRMDALTGRITDLSGEDAGLVEDASPSFSPDGQWIAFTRKYLSQERWTLGRQLWLMRLDGSLARQLTDDPNYHVSSVDWSPDSSILAYVRKNQADINDPVELWTIAVDGFEDVRLISGGYAPHWIP